MSELDSMILGLKEDFDKGSKSKLSSLAGTYHSRISRAKKRGDMQLVNKLAKESRLIPSANFSDPNFKKISYIRYADD